MAELDPEIDLSNADEVRRASDVATLAPRFTTTIILAEVLGLVGIALYNWWVYVAVAGHEMRSGGEFFSDLEASGRPDASMLQHLDLAAGIVLLAALLLRGPRGPLGRRPEWIWLVAFTICGAIGGHFAYACQEGLSATCRRAEWHLQLPLHHYLHVVSGLLEFATMTVAVSLMRKRTRDYASGVARLARTVWRTLLVAYPVLAVAYLSDRFGAFIEPVFFICFSAIVAAEILERRAIKVVG